MTELDDVQILLDALHSQGGGTASIRLDQLAGLEGRVRDTRGYVDLLSGLAHKLELAGDTRTAVMAIPVSVTEKICTQGPTSIEFEGDASDSPTVYLYDGEDFLIDADEEYRKIVPTGSDLRAIFRSWRDAQAAEDGWEFNNFVFVWPPSTSSGA
ncbi:MAG: hypothetical protein QOJ53_567 [Sphingomonadales bacterium]|jgi:hypothetical protein|nr:hypothetical protein [Sphingomonadales bacterium]MEA3044717.1 hypothetical protein [Sphingomonadales bacterium]MEA3046235.1 hypothetical protein [Sphingomonadales bacterium]